jgi:tetrahydromethanopterin S-methyltransferase subunit H
MAARLGADLLMFGPIENCEAAATSAAFCDIVLAETYPRAWWRYRHRQARFEVVSLIYHPHFFLFLYI